MVKFYLSLFMVLVLVGCADKHIIPTPAISFGETIEDLKEKETNDLFDEDISVGHPSTMHYILRMKTLKFLTHNKDTITYWFMRGHLFSTLITMKNEDYSAILTNLQNNKSFQSINDKCFTKSDEFIRVGIEPSKKVSLLYLNNKDKEIEDLIKDEIFQEGEKKSNWKSNEIFEVQVMIAFYATGYVKSSSPFNSLSDKYYENIFKN